MADQAVQGGRAMTKPDPFEVFRTTRIIKKREDEFRKKARRRRRKKDTAPPDAVENYFSPC
jgi:hypothetical protein